MPNAMQGIASYSKSENDRKLLGRHLTPETAGVIISMALYWAKIHLESSGCVVHIHYVSHILHFITVFVICRPLRCLLVVKAAAAWYAVVDEKLTGDDYAPWTPGPVTTG